MPVAFAGVMTALFLLAVGASLAAAAHPLFAPLVVAVAAGSAHLTISSLPFRRLLWGGLAFIGFVTIPLGLLTHGVLTGGTSFDMRGMPPASLDALSTEAASDSIRYEDGFLLSFRRTEERTAAIAYQVNGRLLWASAVPKSANVDGLSQMNVYPLLWRNRVDLYAEGTGPAWLYIWKWGDAQRLFVLDE
ncbi:hypothetical protein [Longibacter salinarum]|nr:hypothetical protein [Longibacter salinarum]